MKRRPGLRHAVQYDTACAASTANVNPQVEDAQQYIKDLGPGPQQIPLNHMLYMRTGAKNSAGECLLVADMQAFHKITELWCETNCKGDWDIFTSDVYANKSYAYFAVNDDADRFAKEFQGHRNRHPRKSEEAKLLNREGILDLSAAMAQKQRGFNIGQRDPHTH